MRTSARVAARRPFKPHEEHLRYRWGRYKECKALAVAAASQETAGFFPAPPQKPLSAYANLHQTLGLLPQQDGSATLREWLPGAKAVALVCNTNEWEPEGKGEWWATLDEETGVWSLDVPAGVLNHGDRYRLRILTPQDEWVERLPATCRLAAQQAAMGARYDGVFYNPPDSERHKFVHARPPQPRAPRIWECHAGMGLEEEKVGSWREFADEVLPRAVAGGYNAVQLMAVQEHPYYASFGYHVTNLFAPTERCGSPEDLKYLVDKAHSLGLVVLMDVVHSHVSNNCEDGLNGLDYGQEPGQNYFSQGERGYHTLWDSRCYDYGCEHVKRFLLSNIRYWMEEFGFDGYRFDGVTSMLYNHHGIHREFLGDYNEYFGMDTDVEACVYLMLANELIDEINPGGVSVAEDVSGMPTLCRPVSEGGLGFGFRLSMGTPDMFIDLLKNYHDEDWSMSRIVSTLCNRRQLVERCIAYTESHDQALVGDKTHAMWLMDAELYTGMSALEEATETILRGCSLHKLIRLVTMGLGGEGYLTFFGNEFGHPEWIDFPREGNEWSHKYCRRQWTLADTTHLRYRHLGQWEKEMMNVEKQYLFMTDPWLWVSRQSEEEKVIVFERGHLLFVLNLHPINTYEDYKVPARDPGTYRIILDSDMPRFGGLGRVPGPGWEVELEGHVWKDGPWDLYTTPEIEGYEGREQSLTLPILPARTAFVLVTNNEG